MGQVSAAVAIWFCSVGVDFIWRCSHSLSVNAFAGSQPKENLEAVVQIHAQVGILEGVSDYNDFKSDKDMFRKDLVTANCKEIRASCCWTSPILT